MRSLFTPAPGPDVDKQLVRVSPERIEKEARRRGMFEADFATRNSAELAGSLRARGVLLTGATDDELRSEYDERKLRVPDPPLTDDELMAEFQKRGLHCERSAIRATVAAKLSLAAFLDTL